MPSDQDDIAKQAREHAWNWFALHAAQRMQTFNFFVVATAFLIAAYASLLEKHPAAAAVLAILGAFLAGLFNRLERRSHQLVKAGERALKVSQEHLAGLAENPHLKILEAVERPAPRSSTYRFVINAIQWIICTLFVLMAAYAFWLGYDRTRSGLDSVRPFSSPMGTWSVASNEQREHETCRQ
jgi:hypothetical protein